MIWYPFTQAKTSFPPLYIKQAKGVYLIDENNKKYIDLISSWWVNLHGHAHPVIANAIYNQAITLEHVIFANTTHTPAKILSQKLCQLSGFDYVFFSDNGSTAVEVALKMSYQFYWNQGQKNKKIFLNLEGGYHGDTFGAMSVGKTSNFYKPFEDFLFETIALPIINKSHDEVLQNLENILKRNHQNIAAFILEPLVQGASGMRMYDVNLLEEICILTKQYDVHIIFDEVMTGFGRTGKMFAKDHIQVQPDFMCLSKGITGGFLPLAATLTSQKIYDAFLDESFSKAFAHGHSYAGSPLGCAAGIASLSLFDDQTWRQINTIEKIHKERSFGDVCGTISSFETQSVDHAKEIIKEGIRNGFFLRPLGKKLYIIPPYCISEQELNSVYDFLDHYFK